MDNNMNEIKHANECFENALAIYLHDYAMEHEEFLPCMAKPNKNIVDCANYIMAYARKQAQNGCAALPDQLVYDMAVKYYEDDSITYVKEQPKQSVSVSVPTPKADGQAKIVPLKRAKKPQAEQFVGDLFGGDVSVSVEVTEE